ncbi:MAG: C25 family cysteine peptidase [Saprospiraceae bacterium]
MRYILIFILISLLSLGSIDCQMTFNGKKLFGNEWLVKGQSYYKFNLAADGFYRINFQTLLNSGLPVQSIRGDQFQLFKLGQEVPIRTTTQGVFGPNDYIEFMGFRNRAELDETLFKDKSELFNSEYSIFTDSLTYFLTWTQGSNNKRISEVNNDLVNLLPKDLYYTKKVIDFYNEVTTKRSFGYQHTQKMPDFDEGQGYGTDYFTERTFSINFKNLFKDFLEVNIKATLFGYGEDASAHKASFYLDNEFKDFTAFSGFKVRQGGITLNAEELKEQMNFKILADGNRDDRLSVSKIEYSFPAEFKFDQSKFSKLFIPNSLTKRYLEIEDFNGGNEIIVYDLTNQIYLLSSRETNGIYKINLPASQLDREIIILNKDQVNIISELNQTNFPIFENSDYDFIIVSSDRLINGNLGNNQIQAYLNYRSSTEGGGHKVKLVSVEDIYNSFGYGIYAHAISMRNFFQYSRLIWPNTRFVLLIGKGLEYHVYRKNNARENNFVPTHSAPAADYMMVSDSARIPFYALGRIPAVNGNEISDYLNKVKEHENFISSTSHNITNREWLKKVIHLSGGDPTLFGIISSQLASMEDVIENNQYGAQVETFYKQSSSAIEVSNSERLKSLVDNGVSIISFMGHSVAFRLDFNLENISSYENKGKYHLFVAMGCYAGQMFDNIRSISETHNLAADRGSIIYLANSTSGLPYVLSVYGSEFYRQLGGKYYGKAIGEAIKEVNTNMVLTKNESIIHQALSTSFNGDPSIAFNNNPGQDFTIDASTAKINPGLIYANNKEFKFSVDLVNLGVNYRDSINLLIQNEGPDGKITNVYDALVPSPSLRSNFEFTIPVNGDKSIGFNKLYMKVDANEKIAESPNPIAENNNELISISGEKGFKYYVIGDDARPVYPQEFSIIKTQRPTLLASTGNAFANPSTYFLEIDTTEYFNSPVKKVNAIYQKGGVISWPLENDLSPNTVYYWRVRPDSLKSGILAWRNSSFIYLPGEKTGWNQSHYFQHAKNNFNQMEIEEPERSYTFKEGIEDFRVFNAATTPTTFLRPKIFYRSQVEVDYNHFNFRNNISGILVSVFHPLNGSLLINQTGGDFKSESDPAYAGQKFFLYQTETKEQRQNLIEFLENGIPNNAVVVLSSLVQNNGSFYPESWDSDGQKNLYSILHSYGAKNIENLKLTGSVPYIFIFRKNRSDYIAKESFGNLNSENDLGHFVYIKYTEGSVNSTLIGPAKSYESFSWDFNKFDGNEDVQSINIYGLDNNGIETKLFGPFSDQAYDLRGIDASKYPYLKLEWNSKDSISRTSPNNAYWRVYYSGYPDIAINPNLWFKKSADTLNQGSVLNIEVLAQNLSDFDMDSLLVKFTSVGTNNIPIIQTKRFAAVKSMGSIKIPLSISTAKQSGAFKLYIELNPDNDQPELNLFNNIGIVDYYVRKDLRKPRVTVAFDGKPINNGEIVSPTTKIEITLKDENLSFPLEDTSLFNIKLKYPDRTIKQIYFSQLNVKFFPATLGQNKNEARVTIDGDFNLNGSYELLLRAKDANGNQISDADLLTSFTIVRESSVSNIFNYPNPFTTKTRFVYTLTGSEIPAFYKIQILTISGKVIKEIDQFELGPLNIGTHITDYEYDGTDDFGSKLANGVYLYKVVFKDQSGKEIKKFNTGTDEFFKNNYGKMVIIR